MRLRALLQSDAEELFRPVADFWIGLTRRHPIGMPVFDLVVYVVGVVVVWIFVGPTAGLAALAITLALYAWGMARVLRRRRGQSN